MMTLRPADLRQHLYCPRVTWFTRVIPVKRVETYRMIQGHLAESEHERLERRRDLSRYGLEEGRRRFHVRVFCNALGFSGEVDEVIDTPSGAVPVEVKRTAGGVALGHRAQLAAYAMALEEMEGVHIARGFVHLVPEKRVVEVAIDGRLRALVMETAESIRALVEEEVFPPATANPAKCDGCELRRFCNDVD